MAFTNLEDLEPEKSDTYGCDADNGAGEEIEHQEQEDNIIYGKDFSRLDQYPVHWVKDFGVS